MNRIGLLFGMAFGFLLTAARVNDYDVIHRMLLLQEPDLYLLMASTVGVALPLLWLLQRRGWQTPLGGRLTLTRSPVERKHVLGGAVFGIGWAVAGTCPGAVLALVGTGGLLGLVVVAGLFVGVILRDAVAAQPAARPAQPADSAPQVAG